MNIYMLLGIGMLAAGVIMGAMFCMKKMRRLIRFIYAGLVTAAGVALLVCGLTVKEPVVEASVSPLTMEEQVEFAYAFVQQGEYEIAEELMEEYADLYGYDETCSLFAARIQVLQGNYAVAGGVYARLQENEEYKERIEAEYALVQSKNNVDLSAMATVRYLKEQGLNPADYGFSETEIQGMESTMEVTDDIVVSAVMNIISEEYKTKGFEKTVSAVTEASRLYDLFLNGSYSIPDEEMTAQIKSVRKTLEKKLDSGEGYCNCVRNALLRMNVLLRDYDKIAENIDERSTYVELMVVSELYMNKLVREKDFKGTYIGSLVEENNAYSDVVGKQIKDIYKDNKKSLEEEEKEDLEMLVDYWKIESKHPVLTAVRTLLEDRAREGATGSDLSKVYLQLAKIAHYYENQKNRSDHLAGAIESGSDSEDSEYSAAMEKIAAIINGEGDINEVLNVSAYVERALQNAMPDGMDAFLTIDGLDLYDNENKEPVSLSESFEQVFEEYVNTTRSAVNISVVDTEEFETVTVRMSVSSDYAVSAEQLRKILQITDCGFEIDDFTVEKLEYTEGRTHLACDVSGSMDNCIGDLRNAVIAYINGRNPAENLAISSFTSYIEKTLPFGSSNEDLTAFANSFNAWGGTSIYGTIMSILENFDSTAYSNNSLILMTDGEDGDYVTDSMIVNDLAARAKEKNVKVYTIGLGSVNAGYLTKIAEAGGGVFVHTKESSGLDALYSFLQGQVGNQYIITFKAKDTLTAKNRVLEAKINNGEARCDFTYSLDLDAIGNQGGNSGNAGGNGGNGGNSGNSGNAGTTTPAPNTGSAGTGTIESETEEEELPVSTLRLLGLATREIHQNKTGCYNSVNAYGAEFSEGMNASVKIYNDDYQRTMVLKYKSAYSAEFIVPKDIKQGTYDVEVTVDGKKGYLSNALVISEMKLPTIVKFGAYEFVADNVTKNSDTNILLYGNVTMNGWLRFKGAVRITGDLENDAYVSITDNTGCYVEFDSIRSIGYAKHLAEKNMTLSVHRLGTFNIYNDFYNKYNLDDYETDNIALEEFFLTKVCCVWDVGLRLYPDRMELSFDEVQTKIPFQDMIFGGKEKERYDSGFDDRKIVVTDKSVGFTFSYEKKRDDEAKLLNTTVDLEELKFSINTVNDEYSAGILFNFLGFPSTGASMTVTDVFSDKVEIKDFSITMPIEFTKNVGPVPVTFSKFTFGIEGGNLVEKFEKKQFATMTFVGKMDMSTAKFSAVVPKLSKYIKDEKEILSMPATTLKFTPSPFCISGEANLYFMKKVQLANAQIEIGQFTYSNPLLDMDSVTTNGVRAELGVGFKWEEDALSVDIGAAGELNAHTQLLGIQLKNAHIDATLKWWIFDKEIEARADALIGFTKSKKGKGQFNIVLAYTKDKKYVRNWYYINADEGFEAKTDKTKIKN